MLSHIKEYSLTKGIFIDTINCVEDHIHMFVSLGPTQTIANIANLIKGESSHWVNSQNIIKNKFEWQNDYMALSVGKSGIKRVRQYILNQEEHHKKKKYIEEYEQYLKISITSPALKGRASNGPEL